MIALRSYDPITSTAGLVTCELQPHHKYDQPCHTLLTAFFQGLAHLHDANVVGLFSALRQAQDDEEDHQDYEEPAKNGRERVLYPGGSGCRRTAAYPPREGYYNRCHRKGDEVLKPCG